MKKISFERFAKSALEVPYQKEDSYLVSYREFINYFARLEKIEAHNFIIATHFTYGWMPRILKLKGLSEDINLDALYPHLVETLNKVKRSREIKEMELKLLVHVVNNSLVGVSKLLHFINPVEYAIWDSWVYKYINGKKPHQYQINDIEKYKVYLQNCTEISGHYEFPEIQININEKIGYEVSAFRAIEWVMYMSAK
jgi:hypothetical protein